MTTPFGHIQNVNVGSNQAVRIREFGQFLVKAASTANVSDLSAVSSTMDGVTCANGDVVLLKNQSTPSQNGPYAFSGISSGTGVLTRVPPITSDLEVFTGLEFYVESGTANAGRIYRLSTAGAITVGSTSLSFARFSVFDTTVPYMQAVDATLASGTITINTGIVVASNSEVIPLLIGAITGSTNFGSVGELKASRVAGAAGVGTVVIQAYGANGALDSDAAGAIRVVILTPQT